ncbi:MAG: hypothetical protein GVY26_12825, partial [Bacteroidetes bacterium]|nr:hypothetical protein [Bacteroidota bacterium]
MTQIFVRPCWGIVYRVLTVLMLTVCSFGSASAQQWETVKMYDFSDPAFGPQLGGVDGFSAAYYFLSGNGASGDAADPCGKSISLQGYIAMQQPLEAGVNYRLSVNAKTTNSFYWLGFYYSTFPSTQLGTVIDNYVQVDGVSTITDPGNDYVSSTFTVGTDGTYWLILRNQSGGSVILDNFTLERETGTANLPNFSLTMAGENDPVSEISMAPGGSAEICLTPDSAPATDMTLDVQVNGNTNPHFDGFSASLTFPAGSTAQQCVTLSPANTPDEASYDFEVVNSDGGETVAAFSVTVAPECTGVAGPDQMICEGESVELGTGCLPDPHPVDGVEYCYAWEPVDGLDDPAAVMPSASPTETTAYTVYVTSSEGELIVEEEVTVTVESFDFDITSTSQVLCQGESALLEVPDSYVEYSWIKDEEVIGDDHTVEVFSSGLYSIEITNSNGCTSTAEIYIAEVSDPLSMKELFLNKGFMCVPIDVVGVVGLQNPSTQNNRSALNSFVEDCANLNIQIMDEGGEEGFNIADVMESYLSNPNFSMFNEINGYVTADEVFCSPLQSCSSLTFDQIEDGFLSSDLGYWTHIWENPNIEGDDCLLIAAKLPALNNVINPLVHPISLEHEELIMASLELLQLDGPNSHFPNLWERLSYALLDLLRNQFLPDVLQSSWCEGCQLSLQSEAPQDPQNPTKSMTWFINEIMAIEDNYPPEEQTNLKLMITRFRRIFYNSDGFNNYLIPGAASEASQSPFGSPSVIERNRLTVERGAPFGDFDLIDNEIYPIDPLTLERPDIYVNQQVELDAGN